MIYGDADNDGLVTAQDALLCLKNVVKLYEMTAEEKIRTDVDADKQITAQDALCILRKVVKLVDLFPVENQQELK